MKHLIYRFRADGSGSTAMEYALIAFLIAVPIIAGVTLIGVDVNGVFNSIVVAFAAA
jgi:pilus assembly protein Flp/PilA